MFKIKNLHECSKLNKWLEKVKIQEDKNVVVTFYWRFNFLTYIASVNIIYKKLLNLFKRKRLVIGYYDFYDFSQFYLILQSNVLKTNCAKM